MMLIRKTGVAIFVCAAAVCGRAQERIEGRFDTYRSGFHLDTLALQVLLDRQNLSCNCVDGMWGARTEIALVTWQTLQGLPATGIPDASVLEALGGATNILTRYTVTEADLANIAPVPDAWEERAKLPAMNYETIQEMLAEKGHTSQRALERLNPGLAWPNPPAGADVVLPNCPASVSGRASSVRIALTRMEISAFDADGKMIALFPCSIARDKSRRPAGELRVKNIAPNPTYLYDPQLFVPGGPKTSKLVIPPGPNNPVGLAWAGLSLQGYGVHGAPLPERIGNAESHGCFRLANWNAVKLIGMVRPGVPVVVED
jgi:lipoprotein-anchoring transpeptidase ErfK/SrfK